MVTLNGLRLKIGSTKGAGKLRDILEAAGEFAVSESQNAFQTQKFGGEKWPRRYPNQRPFVINVAGAVSDWATGEAAKARRLKSTPAAIDTARLRDDIAKQITGPESVEVGSNLAYAERVNAGLRSIQPVTKQVRKGLAAFLRSRPKSQRQKFSRVLGFLFNTNTLTTKLARRQFIGVTPTLEKDLAALVKAKLEGRL